MIKEMICFPFFKEKNQVVGCHRPKWVSPKLIFLSLKAMKFFGIIKIKYS